ncbi:MAG: hypothetical protein ACOC9Y_10945 [Chloroflexota bacterium]
MRYMARAIAAVTAIMIALIPAAALAQSMDDRDGLLLRVGGSDRVEAGERVDTVVVIDGDLDVAGTVDSVIVVVNGDIQVENGAVVGGDIVLIDGEVMLRDGSVVTGDINLDSNARVVSETGAEHTGEVNHDAFDFDLEEAFAANLAIGYFSTWIVLLVVSVIAAVIFAGVGGRQLQSAADYITARPAGTILSGIFFWVGIVLLSMILLLTIFAAPLIVPLLMVTSAVWFIGMLVAGARLGAFLLRRPADDPAVDHPYAISLLGTLVLQIVAFVAGGGGIFLIIIAMLSDDIGLLGALIGIPIALLGFTALLAGFLGTGAVVYRALHAWTQGRDAGRASY